MKNIDCPNCSSELVKRVQTKTVYERLASWSFIYPFRCQNCDYRFRSLQPGLRSMRVDEDRREYQRIDVEFPAWLKNDILRCDGAAIELSMDGCTVRTDRVPPQASIVSVGFRIPGETKPVTITAAIVCSVGQDRVGLEFLRFQGNELQRLRRLVHGLVAAAAAPRRFTDGRTLAARGHRHTPAVNARD